MTVFFLWSQKIHQCSKRQTNITRQLRPMLCYCTYNLIVLFWKIYFMTVKYTTVLLDVFVSTQQNKKLLTVYKACQISRKILVYLKTFTKIISFIYVDTYITNHLLVNLNRLCPLLPSRYQIFTVVFWVNPMSVCGSTWKLLIAQDPVKSIHN